MTRRRKVVQNEAEIMSRNHSKVVRSWSTTHYISEELEAVAREIKSASGVHCDKSKLLNAFTEILIENRHNLTMGNIVDARTMKDELALMIKRAPKPPL